MSVVFPASGWEMIANVRRRATSGCMADVLEKAAVWAVMKNVQPQQTGLRAIVQSSCCAKALRFDFLGDNHDNIRLHAWRAAGFPSV